MVVDCAVAVVGCLLAFYAASQTAPAKKKRCYIFLVLIAMLDGILSSYVHAALNRDSTGSQMGTLELMDKLYTSECFTRQQDKVIFETSQTLKEYAETLVAVQIALAFSDAVYHLVSVVYFKDTITEKLYVTASALFGAGEFVAAVVGVASYIDVTRQFSSMYSQMNRAAGAGFSSQACVSSCCLPPGIAVASASGVWGGSVGAIAGIAAAASIVFLSGVWCCIRSVASTPTHTSGGARAVEMGMRQRRNPMDTV